MTGESPARGRASRPADDAARRTHPTRRRRRGSVLAVLAVVIVTGVVVARTVPDPVGDMAADLLYATAAYLLVVLVLPGVRPVAAALAALAWCWAVEAFQATGAATAIVDAFPPAVWAFGTTFAARDLVLYTAGVAAAWVVDVGMRRRSALATPTARTSG